MRLEKAMIAAVMSVGLLAGTAHAADRFDADASHTRILFTVNHLGYSTQIGVFHDFSVDFAFDRAAPQNSTLAVSIDVASVDMFDGALNDHLKTADFFDAAHHPKITFASTKVEAVDETHARVTGDLTLRGKTLPATFDVTLNRLAPNPRTQKLTAGFTATGTVDRTQFGMTYGAPFVGAEIAFTIAMEAVLAEGL